jgi:hypothetical protein
MLFTLLLVTAACRSDTEETQPESRMRVLEAPPQPLTVESAANEEVVVDTQLGPLVETAKQDLAKMLSAKPETIGVSNARYVTWPDSSLGCPQPDLMYMQVLTEGVLIVLRHGGKDYYYHGSREGHPFDCEQPRNPVVGEPSEASR